MMASRVAAIEAASQLTTRPSHNHPRVRDDLSDLSSGAGADGSSGNTTTTPAILSLSRDSQFSSVEVLQHAQLPFKDKALRLLTGLANDEGTCSGFKRSMRHHPYITISYHIPSYPILYSI